MTAASNVNTLVTQAKAIAQKLGIQKFDIYGSTVDETSVEVERGATKQVNASNRAGVTVRVWNENHTVGIASTTNVDPSRLEIALGTAYEASFFGVKENVPDFSPDVTVPVAEKEDETAPQVPVATLIDTLLAAEKELLKVHPAIQGVPYNGLSQTDTSRFYINSDGAMRRESHSHSSIYLYSKTEEEGKKPRGSGAYRVSRSFEQLDVRGCLQEAAEKTISHLNYEKIPSGKYRVVFTPEAFLSLLYAFSSLFNAQNVLDKQSLSTPESLGTQIASTLLSVYDDELYPGNVGAIAFDSEGTPTRCIALIRDGILTNFLHSSVTAKRMNVQPTGHGNIGAKVTVSPHFFHVLPGAATERSYSLDEAENIILIDALQALHAGVQALQGSFSLPFSGWVVNKGQRTSIDSATVAGDFRELLKSIIYIEPEAKLTPKGVSPRVWIDSLSITGD